MSPLLLIRHPPTVFPSLIFFSGSEFISGIGMSGGDFVFVNLCWRGEDGDNWGLFIWGPYQKRFSPTPSSQWGSCTLIWCAGTRDPRRQ